MDAKVIQLDYNNNRIFLSLKDVKVLGLMPLSNKFSACWIGTLRFYFVDHIALSPVMQPKPSVGALEAVIGEDLSLGGALEPVQADFEVCTSSSFIKHGLDMGYF